jgi:hypothetical protein
MDRSQAPRPERRQTLAFTARFPTLLVETDNKEASTMPPTAASTVLGIPGPDFRLPATDRRTYALQDIAGLKGTVIAFICNQCPYVKAVIDRLVMDAMTGRYRFQGAWSVAAQRESRLVVIAVLSRPHGAQRSICFAAELSQFMCLPPGAALASGPFRGAAPGGRPGPCLLVGPASSLRCAYRCHPSPRHGTVTRMGRDPRRPARREQHMRGKRGSGAWPTGRALGPGRGHFRPRGAPQQTCLSIGTMGKSTQGNAPWRSWKR